ncbi:ABC transporter permease [Thermopolyspora sp. NPDC052614]|uniref:ABC transporter permease n=1 Tax=Thermopolyspora sp. NPDC052614 TaxID=3155682 RepID=UPI00342E191D
MRRALPAVLLLVAIVVGWEQYVTRAGVSVLVVPPPSGIAAAIVANRADLAHQTLVTLTEASLGFLLGNLVAIVCAVAFTYSGLLRAGAYPLVLALQAIPLVAIAPILVLWLGPGVLSKVLLAAFLAYTVTLVTMVRGLGSADVETLELMHTLNASRWQELTRVRFPASLPYLFTSLRLGASAAIVAAIAAEYVGALEGLGYLIHDTRARLDNAYLWAAVVTAAAIGLAAFGLVVLVERWAMPWRRGAVEES